MLIIISLYGAFAMSSFILIPESLGRVGLLYGGLVGFFVGAYVPLHGLVWAVYFGRAHVGAISGSARPAGHHPDIQRPVLARQLTRPVWLLRAGAAADVGGAAYLCGVSLPGETVGAKRART